MYQPSESLPTSASVDLTALAQNVAHVRRLAKQADVLAVVKANAYGHGAVEITRALQQLAIHRFGVATVDEGIGIELEVFSGRGMQTVPESVFRWFDCGLR
ncbi:MAG TPA: hypothetical protein DCP31_33325 [Cyanobacteria bacterium UBA8543]|nr:hypothetical protein [Cyanobacteria bacterium UBA8543]